MGYIRIQDTVPHHKKILKAGPHAAWLWLCGIAYCQRMRTDGFIPFEAMPMLGVAVWKKYAGVCVSAGLMHREDAGYRIHDYLEWNASAEERDEKTHGNSERQRRWRKSHQLDHNAVTPSQSNAVTPESRNADLSITTSVTTTESAPPPPRGGGGLLVSPMQFAKMQEKFAYVGARLRVPHVLHDELRTKLGGENPDARLRAWYGEIDAEAERTGEPIPDVFTWLRPKFVPFASAASSASNHDRLVKMLEGAHGR